ncbi:MAG: NAD(P)/FAD-dependent oxidoreductase [Negativicutes bacterium]|nr:NAD(P)/FAD-dependent oxidoreductase [Negativicutes bacterium]
MFEAEYDVVIVGGGPAGMAAAVGAAQNGAERIALIERDDELGGILQQCIHNGFGLHRFGEELTGPQYAGRFIRQVAEYPNIEVFLDTTVLEVTPEKQVYTVNPQRGIGRFQAKAVVLAMGCRERSRGAIAIPGHRPAGVFTAGTAQRMVNREGYLPGKRVVILGSGDIGLIMARRLTLEGAEVAAVLEIMPYSNGLTRNIVQCLEDFDIPLYLSHTVTAVKGAARVTEVTCAAVDEELKPIPGTEFAIACDCLLLSVGLIPENELSRSLGIEFDRRTGGPVVDQTRQTSAAGFFAAGNVLHVHDLVDWVSAESETAGRSAARYARGLRAAAGRLVRVEAGSGVRVVVPQRIDCAAAGEYIELYCRVASPERNLTLALTAGGRTLFAQRLPLAKPSEMATLKVPKDCLGENPPEAITLVVKHADRGEEI